MQGFRRPFGLALLQFAFAGIVFSAAPSCDTASQEKDDLKLCCTVGKTIKTGFACNKAGRKTVCESWNSGNCQSMTWANAPKERVCDGESYTDHRYSWKFVAVHAGQCPNCWTQCGCTQCTKGKYETVEATLSTDRTCANCPENRYSDENNLKCCKFQTGCPAGTSMEPEDSHQLRQRSRACIKCPKGKYQDAKVHFKTTCTPCSSDKTTLKEGSISATDCMVVKVEAKASSHRLWIKTDQPDAFACAVTTVQVLDKVNNGATPIVIPAVELPAIVVPAEDDPSECGTVQSYPKHDQSYLLSSCNQDHPRKHCPVLCHKAPNMEPEECSVSFKTWMDENAVKFTENTKAGKDLFGDYPLKLTSNVLTIPVRPGKTFSVTFRPLQYTTNALNPEEIGAVDPIGFEITTPCGCSKAAPDDDEETVCIKRGAAGADGTSENQIEKLDCAVETDVFGNKIDWLSDSTGKPGRAKTAEGHDLPLAKQHFGLIQFQWTDYSLCEEAFSFSREVNNDGRIETFVEDAFFAGNSDCGERVNIPSVVDNLWPTRDVVDKVAPFEDRKYCIRAVSKGAAGSEGYSSPAVCEDLSVNWEAGIQGRVLARQGNIPIEGVEVSWEIRNATGYVSASSATVDAPRALSDHDGRFFLHLIEEKSNLENVILDKTQTRTIHLKYSKRVGRSELFHEFLCPGGVKCGGVDPADSTFDDFKHRVTATHLVFDTPASVVDATTLPFTGNVFFPLEVQDLPEGTDPNQALTWPERWSRSPDQATNVAGEMRCPLRDARVCQHAYTSSAEELACATTKPDGTYELAAVPSIPTIIRVTLGDHEPSQFQRRQGDHAAGGMSEPKPSLTPDVDCLPERSNCDVEVFAIEPNESSESNVSHNGLNKMHYEDRTTAALNVDVHGTLCKYPLGDVAFVKFSVPYCGSKTVALQQTPRKEYNLVQLPAHVFDVTLDAVEPPYPEATDPSQMGYFHRLRTRSRRIDLSAEPTKVGISEGPAVAAGVADNFLSVVFQYHPAPDVNVRFVGSAKDGTLETLASQNCSQTNVVDTSIGQESFLTDQSPKWEMRAGTEFIAVAEPLATIKFPTDQFSVCDWIEGRILHRSNVGLSRADRANWFKMDEAENRLIPKDATTTQFKDFARILNKSLPLKVKMADLAKCADPDDPACAISTVHDTRWTVRTDFSADLTCSVVKETGKFEFGYKPISGDAELCKAQWSKRSSSNAFQAWHLLDWDSELTPAQRDTWESVGVTKDLYSRGQTAGTWNEFSKVVLATTDTWSNLETRNLTSGIASELHFTSDTWGRAWAFANRIFLNDIAVLPSWKEDLTSAEQVALETIGFTEDTWSEKDPAKIFNSGLVADRFKKMAHNKSADVYIYKSNGTVKTWAAPAGSSSTQTTSFLSDVQKGNISEILRITPWHWKRSMAAASSGTQVEGCFWDHGRGEATTTAWFSNSVEKEELHRSRRQVDRNERTRRDSLRACPAGEQSTEDGKECEQCPAGSYKSAMDRTCKQKTVQKKVKSCFPGSSAVRDRDDSECLPEGECPKGQEPLQGQPGECKPCPEGTFKAAASADPCIEKGLEKCKEGEYKIAGSSATADDNTCITCPMGTFSNTTTATECTVKEVPSSCGKGSFLKLGTGTTEDDNACSNCPSGTWKSEAVVSLSCIPKELTTCPPGEYFVPGNQADVDDNVCLACPPGTFTASTSNAKSCLAKNVVAEGMCLKGQRLHEGLSSVADDNVCLMPGSCAPGYSKTTNLTANGKDACTPCAPGTFAPRVSTTKECEQKAVQECPPGSHVFFGSSSVTDDSYCITCPPGTFKGPEHSNTSAACFLKRALPETCPIGSHVSRGLNATLDDHECQLCPIGTYQKYNSTKATSCTLKVRPAAGCPAGKYLSLGESKAKDDYECKECAVGTFKPVGALARATGCFPKTTKDQCKGAEMLLEYNVSDQNDKCVMPARCLPGQRVAKDKVACEKCPDGQYNAGATVSQNCTAKKKPPGGCGVGTYFMKGNDPKRNDWSCVHCPPGMYSSTTVDLAAVSNCSRKEPPPSGCGPGEEMYWGLSKVESDWFCVPTSRITVLCAKSRKAASRSIATNLAAGIPLQNAPFTTQYRASITVNGYAPVTTEEIVVITGSRFVSDAERLPFPEGRPLLTIHDPPGGGSFSSFTDTIATAFVRETASSTSEGSTVGGSGGPQVGGEIEILGEKPFAFEISAVGGSTGSKINVQTSLESELIEDDSFTFSYQTSNSPAFAGPAGDAFLMPALSFEVIEIWIVKFSSSATTQNDCSIRGFTDKSLKARTDLSAFYFITANDVETRTLPSLLDFSDDVKRRLGCDDGLVPCCTEQEARVECKATSLSEYCEWKYSAADDTTGGLERCKQIAEDHWKTKCQTAAALARQRMASRAVWSECVTSTPSCSDGLQRSGSAVQCESEIEESFIPPPDTQKLADDAEGWGKDDVKGEIKSVDRLASETIACMGSGCTSAESSFKVKCIPLQSELGPLGACSKYPIYANSVDQYCNEMHKRDNTIDAQACSTFTRTDQYSKAHDDWYNTLGRNYAKQEKAMVGADVAVNYTVLDTLNTGDEPVESDELVVLEPMTGLAPQMLFDNAMDRDGELQSDEKRTSFNEFNTLSFEGGGSLLDVMWETGGVANGNDFSGHVSEKTSTREDSKSNIKSFVLDLSILLFYIGPRGHFEYEKLADSSELVTQLESSSEEAETAFTLSDPDPGDYFVLTVWQDPEYPTPLFAIQGGG